MAVLLFVVDAGGFYFGTQDLPEFRDPFQTICLLCQELERYDCGWRYEKIQKRLKYKVKSLEKRSTPTYSPNAWTDLAHFSAREPSCEYFQTHRGDFRILSWKPRYGHIWRFLRGRIGVPKMSIFGSYLGSEDEIKKSPRCVRKYSYEGSLAKK